MNIHAEIKWIQNQLNEVTDPDLIAAFKNLLQYRKKKTAVPAEDFQLTEEHIKLLEQAEERYIKGTSNTYTSEDVKAFARARRNA